MATGEDALRLLADISMKLTVLIDIWQKVPTTASTPPAPFGAGTATAPPPRPDPPPVASDFDLDGKFGDPEVRAKSPRDWTGEAMLGRKFSECPAEYLDLVASRLDYFASVNEADPDPEAQKKARWNKLDAARARGWAARIRAGHVAPVRPQAEPGEPLTTADFDESIIPF